MRLFASKNKSSEVEKHMRCEAEEAAAQRAEDPASGEDCGSESESEEDVYYKYGESA